MKPPRLLTPGPTQVPPEILAELARPMGHHRSAEYRDALRDVCEGLQYVLQTRSTCVTITGSGTAGCEAAIVSTCAPGRRALVVRNGKFAERWAVVCQTYGIDHTCYDLEWGEVPTAEQIGRYLADDAKIGYVILVHCETSAGSLCDLRSIAQVTRECGAILIVDAISSGGAVPLYVDEWGVDVVVVGSQKALMLPPGLAFVAVSERAWAAAESFSSPALYLCLKAYRKALRDLEPPYSPAIPLVMAARASLRRMRAEGVEAIWARTAALARATRAAGEAIGLKLFSAAPSDSVTAFRVPEGIDDSTLRARLRDEHGILIAGGQGKLKGKIIRIGHMGAVDTIDTLGALAAMEIVLASMGYAFTLGAGVAAAQRELAGTANPPPTPAPPSGRRGRKETGR